MSKMGALESRFADIIWNNEPLASRQLVKMAEQELGWKSTTSYTVLKRLCERGIFQNQNSTVTSLISREEFYAEQSDPEHKLCRVRWGGASFFINKADMLELYGSNSL